MSLSRKVPDATRLAQHSASNPAASAWVSANAGSGKTHVLAQRVVRLLLAGTPPGRILCLTFTKTAAANMADRVFQTLARWTLMGDAELAGAIETTGAGHPDPQDMIFARRLFARTLETPGGLKIQTIHAFCERLLHMFPFEANVAAGFEVIEPLAQAELLAQARLATLETAIHDDGAMGKALAELAGQTSEGTFENVLREALRYRADLAERAMEPPGAALAHRLGLRQGETEASIVEDMLNGGIEPGRWAGLADWFGGGLVTDQKNAAKLQMALAQHTVGNAEAALDDYLALFFTTEMQPRKKLATNGLAAKAPKVLPLLEGETLRLQSCLNKRRAATTVARTGALVLLAQAIFERYEQLKAQRGVIDFEDLILRTKGLLSRSDAAWVLYKLDSGIDHILVDEAQDTSPAQWDILKALASDFTAGAGQRRQQRTLFAVGDEKQSIYSFQGAAPHMFAAMRTEFSKRVGAAGQAFASVRLDLSFRSAPEILAAVDCVFSTPENYRGLSADADQQRTVHGALKTDLLGHIEIWPPIAESESDLPPDWQMPLDAADTNAPASRLAQRIARTIGTMVMPGSPQRVRDSASGKARPVSAGDILILVRSRNSFFDAIIRALKDQNVPVAGADRLALTGHIAVMDLMAAGRTALLPLDDLTLACVLKSPLIGLDDDDLIVLAPKRGGSLLAALQAGVGERFARAAARLAQWRIQCGQLTPFQFYAGMLGADGGRRALIERLGQEAGDAIDEFMNLALAHERSQAPSLATFLGRLEAADLEIKRDMEAPGQAVRVMTVHAAKGLEAKIVFLPDTCSKPGAPRDPAVFKLKADRADGFGGNTEAGILAWSPKMGGDPAEVAEARDETRRLAIEENRRLLYVAMTRAEERLYISGFCGVRGPAEGCWHNIVCLALTPTLVTIPAPWGEGEEIWQNAPALAGPLVDAADPVAATLWPDWLTLPAPAEASALPPLRPSQALEAADGFAVPGTQAMLERQMARASGQHLHVLMQYMPGLPAARQRMAGQAYLAAQANLPDAALRQDLLEKALAVANDSRLHMLFGENSIPEVAMSGYLLREDGRKLEISGQIDRLAVVGEHVIIADFKTGRPRELHQTPFSIVTQLALYRALVARIYPGKRVRALVIWTQGPNIVELDAERLDAAVELARMA